MAPEKLNFHRKLNGKKMIQMNLYANEIVCVHADRVLFFIYIFNFFPLSFLLGPMYFLFDAKLKFEEIAQFFLFLLVGGYV